MRILDQQAQILIQKGIKIGIESRNAKGSKSIKKRQSNKESK